MEPEQIIRDEWYEVHRSFAGEDDFYKTGGGLTLERRGEEFSNLDAATAEMRRQAAAGDPVKHLNRKFDYRVVKKTITWEVVAIERSALAK